MYVSLIKYLLLLFSILLIGQYTYWWSFCILAFFMGVFCISYKEAILINSIGSASSWIIMLIYHYYNGGTILISRISNMFGLSNPLFLILISITIPIVLGGISGWTGYQFRRKND